MLAWLGERLPAGGDDTHVRRGPDDLSDELACCPQQVLAIVHDKQQSFVPKVAEQKGGRLGGGLITKVERR